MNYIVYDLSQRFWLMEFNIINNMIGYYYLRYKGEMSMVSLLPSGKENKLVLNFIDEAMRLFGIDCKLYDVSSMNMYLDDRILSECKFYKLLLQDYVDTRLLSNLKWSTVDFNKESIMALMPLQYNNQKFCLREFNVIELKDGTKYQIREVNSTYLVGVWYVVKLIAYNDEPNRPRADKQMKSNYLSTVRDREEFE